MVAAAPVDVRARAVAAATRLFAKQGFEATSVQAVADEVGVTKQAVLHHFPSKEHLRQAVLEAILAHWNEAVPRLLLAATAGEDRFDAIFGELCRFFSGAPDRALVVLREALDRPHEMKKLLRGPVKPWLSAIAGYIEAGKKSGAHYADVDAEAYVVHVLQMVIAASAAASVTSSVLEQDGAPRYDRELARIARASLFTEADARSRSREKPDARPRIEKEKPERVDRASSKVGARRSAR
jgi:AcrR family transcriptional regulator